MNDQEHRLSDFAASEYEKELAAVQRAREGGEKDCFHFASHDEKDCFHEPAENAARPVGGYDDISLYQLILLGVRTLPFIAIYIILFIIAAAAALHAHLASVGAISDTAIHLTTWTFLIGLIIVESVSYFKAYARFKRSRAAAITEERPSRRKAINPAIAIFITIIILLLLLIFFVLLLELFL